MIRETRQRLEGLVADLRAGRVTSETLRLASAIEQIIDGQLEPSNLDAALGLRRRRGRPTGAMTFGSLKITKARDMRGFSTAELLDRIDPVVRFVADQIASDPRPRGAQARALDAAATKFHVVKRAVERRWKRGRPFVVLFASADALSSRIAGSQRATRK